MIEQYVQELLKDLKNRLGLSALSSNEPAVVLKKPSAVCLAISINRRWFVTFTFLSCSRGLHALCQLRLRIFQLLPAIYQEHHVLWELAYPSQLICLSSLHWLLYTTRCARKLCQTCGTRDVSTWISPTAITRFIDVLDHWRLNCEQKIRGCYKHSLKIILNS